ncbi:uncharacterized protein LOC112348482 [Selaginella moellendorffii]|uniref:uncharacterized protein LOC112348482 n=1 Tax=Selaginella moellendorffii TaxID=88036 RepID=UPI000D1C52CF|nr:uncharacterized protein LOC112348482 [Selaginella moellendorffii]|eukprot:XP_024536861.1 uncharacterized protein LOC112348482 [Selaginella moellendorffii]
MDEETERRLAKMIMEEAALLRRRADKEGVHVYLAKPTVRVRPNPQFLQATMRSVEQSNRIVEINEMWRRRTAELNLDRRRRHQSPRSSSRARQMNEEEEGAVENSIDPQAACSNDLRDDEVEEFLNTRIKRGRGSVGSRMDDTGPYPAETMATTSTNASEVSRTKEDWEDRLIGPRLPDKVADAWTKAKAKATESEDDGGSSKKDSKDRKRKKSKSKEHKTKKRKRKATSN